MLGEYSGEKGPDCEQEYTDSMSILLGLRCLFSATYAIHTRVYHKLIKWPYMFFILVAELSLPHLVSLFRPPFSLVLCRPDTDNEYSSLNPIQNPLESDRRAKVEIRSTPGKKCPQI